MKVYDDLAGMRAAAESYAKRTGTSAPGDFGDAHGVTHAFQVMAIGSDGELQGSSEAAAIIRFWRQRLGTGVVTHEVAHAAAAIYEQDWLPGHGAIHDGIDNEEIYCYLIGDLASRIVKRLYHYGMYAT
ncbi:hypothetical protein ACFXKI_01100 [Streptomyces mirabilis]|uniref:hypothetical protein n=1 Tax=Streptomyces mirabilis TaxID=68239 RepID=UPI0036750D15